MKQNQRSTIGVFDSGFGGLTVLKALLEVVPAANYLYFGDTARLPYGSKSVETVARYAVEATRFLEMQGAVMLVMACNTATALALHQIQQAARVPVVGVVEPGASAAAAASERKEVVVIATAATVSSHAYQRALEAHGLEAREEACPLLVPLVEEGWVRHSVTEQVAQIYLNEAFSGEFQSADVLLLGCTHYPLIKPLLHRAAPAHVKIVDSAESTAQVVRQQLEIPHPGEPAMGGTPCSVQAEPAIRFFATDSVEKFRTLGARFLGRKIENVEHVDLKE